MTDETARPRNGGDRDWTIKYADQRFSDHSLLHQAETDYRREVSAALETQRVELRRTDEYAKSQANEWRDTMKDREQTFARKDDLLPIEAKINAISGMQGNFATKREIEVMSDDIRRLREAAASGSGAHGQQLESRQQSQWGMGTTIGLIFGVLGSMIGIAGVIAAFVSLSQK